MAENAGASTGGGGGAQASDGAPGFDAAFDAALAEVEGAEAGDGTGDEGDTPPDEKAGDEAETEDADADADADGKAAAASSTEQDGEGASADDDAGTQDSRLTAILAAAPKEAHKAITDEWNKAFTQRAQELAKQERFLKAFERDPEAAAREVLARAEAKKPVTLPTKEQLTAVLVGKGMKAEDAAAHAEALSEVLKPLQDQINTAAELTVKDAAESEYERFFEEFPDAKEGSPLFERMNELADEINPAPGVSVYKFLKHLRASAKGDATVGERVRDIQKKTVKNAKQAGPKTRPVPSSTVKPGAPGQLLSLEQSFEMASRGEVVGRGISK